MEHDRADKEVSKPIECPMLHLWEGGPLDTSDRLQTSQSDAIWRTGFRCQIIRDDFHLRSPEKTAGMRLLEIGGLKARLLLGNSRSRPLFRHHIAPRIAVYFLLGDTTTRPANCRAASARDTPCHLS